MNTLCKHTYNYNANNRNNSQLIFDFPKPTRYLFENFIVCRENEVAYKASIAICNEGGRGSNLLNPLFIYGDRGTGKTHILMAIGNFFINKNPNAKVVYVSAIDILNCFQNTITYNEMLEASLGYREVDVLLLDDIHLLGDNNFIQDCVFHIYNDLIGKGHRIIIASLLSPNKIKGIGEHLRSRLLWGPVIRIDLYNDKLRKEIIKRLALENHFIMPSNCIDYILNHVDRDIKLYKELLTKVGDYSLRTNKKVSISLLKEVIG